MTTLAEVLLVEGRRRTVVGDCVQLIEEEVRAKSGLTGVAVKGGYAVVKKLRPGIIAEAVDGLLDDFVAQLEPYYAEARREDRAVEPHFEARAQEIANALLAITDKRAARSPHRTLKKAYDKLRPTGVKHTAAAVPGIGRLISRHTGG